MASATASAALRASKAWSVSTDTRCFTCIVIEGVISRLKGTLDNLRCMCMSMGVQWASDFLTLEMAPLTLSVLSRTTVCSRYLKPSVSRVLRCVSLAPAKLLLRVM